MSHPADPDSMDAPLEGAPSAEPRAVDSTDAAAEPAPQQSPAATPPHYSLHADEGSPYLSSASAPNLKLFVERGLTVNEETRKSYPSHTIFLDGVFDGAPFFDNEARQYSLDHHAGCVRAFTLATCEQAAVIVLQGLPLTTGTWRLYINDPDLDAVLACWVLFNHAELARDSAKLLRIVMPFIRVEGIIDAHGLQMGALSGYDEDAYEQRKAQIDRLLAEERKLKAAGQWAGINALHYTQRLLDELDVELFPEGYLASLLEITELEELGIQGERVAVLCRSQQGIYAVEAELKRRHGKHLGLIVLSLGDGRYTLRQVDSFLTKNLTDLYAELNRKDPAVSDRDEGEGRWGGASDIGGSPRSAGSQLEPAEVMQLIRSVYGAQRGWFKRMVSKLSS